MPGGRPTLYNADYHPDQAHKLALLGLTDNEMADIFAVHRDTVAEWKSRYPAFSDAIARGKDFADAEMAQSLYHRGKGYSHDAVKIFMPQGATEPVYAPYTEHYPPDTQAASLWLRNRQGRKWRDKQDIELSGEIGVRQMSDSVLDDRIVQGLVASGMSEEAARAYVARDKEEGP